MYTRLRIVAMLFVAVSGLPSLALSQPDDEDELRYYYGDKDVISIATGIQQPIAKAPAVASVITADDIRNMGATDIDDVLETVPGLHVARNQFFNPIYVFRGIYSNNNPQVLVLVNGISIGNIFQGDRGIAWSGMPVEAISRIEIIRGPGSAVYGADAFAGIINIITKSAEDIPVSEFGVRRGSFSTTEGWLVHGTNWGNTDAAFILEYLKTDGFDEIIEVDAQTALDAVFGTNASNAPGSVNMKRENYNMRLDLRRGQWTFRIGMQNSLHRGDYVGIAQAINSKNFDRSLRWSADLTYKNDHIFDEVDIEAQLSYLHSHHEIGNNQLFPPGANLGGGVFADGVVGNPGAAENQSRFSLSALFTGLPRHQFRLGLGYFYGDLYEVTDESNFRVDSATGTLIPRGTIVDFTDTALTYLREGARKNYYGFGQYVGNIADDWELTLGIRYDDYSDFGSTVNPRAALVWSTTYKLTTKLLYGEAFRAPAFVETRAQNNPATLGNPNLSPEEIRSVELVFDYQANDDLRLSLNLFDYVWDDIIDFFPISGGARRAGNGGEQNGDGFELEAHWQPAAYLSVVSNFSYVNAEKTFLAASYDAANIPSKQFYLRVIYELSDNWQTHVQLNSVLERQRENGDLRDQIDDYTTVNLLAAYHPPTRNWEFSFALYNIFDDAAREPNATGLIPYDYPLAGRHAQATLQFSF